MDTLDEHIVDSYYMGGGQLRRLYGIEFVRFQDRCMWQLRSYLYEKVQMGLIGRVELYPCKDAAPIAPLRLWLAAVFPKIWKDVLYHGIKEYVMLQDTAMMNSTVKGAKDITIWVREK